MLVVEDDADIRTLVDLALTEEGHDVRVVGNGRSALDVLAGWPADVVVLDLAMPVMDGWQFRERQLADEALRDIPVVVTTATLESTRMHAQLAPAALLSKPFELQDLLTAVAQAAGGVPARA